MSVGKHEESWDLKVFVRTVWFAGERRVGGLGGVLAGGFALGV